MPEKKKMVDRLKSHYEPRIRRFSDSHQVLDWENRRSHLRRFQIFVENVPLDGKSLLDVGCGLGDLYGFLRERDAAVEYTGVDILGEMIREARRRHPDGRFLRRDVIGKESFRRKRFDVLFCSGVFNLKIGDNAALFGKALESFFAVARETVVFNLLDEDSPDRNERYFYFNQQRVREQLRPYGWETQIIGDYLPNDFTVICRSV